MASGIEQFSFLTSQFWVSSFQAILPPRGARLMAGGGGRYCTVGFSSSGAPWRRNNCGRFCENAERGSTMSQPTS